MCMKTKGQKNAAHGWTRMFMINKLVTRGDSENVIENKGRPARRRQTIMVT